MRARKMPSKPLEIIKMKQIMVASLLGWLLTGCIGEQAEPKPPVVTLNPAHSLEELGRCTGPANIELNSMESVVDWINEMPKPLTLACFIASLPRPFYFNATDSRSSVQPAVGRLNPRIFIQYDKLWLSFVPQEPYTSVRDSVTGTRTSVWDADGEQLLEFSLEVPSDAQVPQSIKGELAFPIYSTLPRDAAYSRIVSSADESACKTCHSGETRVGSLNGIPIFRSKMLRSAKQTLLQPDDIFVYYFTCDPSINAGQGGENHEWYRCQMLKAFVDQGPIEWRNFRSDITPCIQE